MTWTYSGDPAASALDEVRFLIGDTDTTDQQLQDAEINYAIAKFTANNFRAASLCCNNLASKYARLVDTSIETVRISYSQKAKHYKELSVLLWQTSVTAIVFPAPYIAGVSIADILSNRGNTDRPPPQFRNNLFNNPSSGVNFQDTDDNFGN